MASQSPFIKQASSMMQTPDAQGQQLELQRQQALINALRQQGNESLGETQVVSGRAIPITGLQAGAKIAQQLAAAYGQQKLDEKQVDLTARQQAQFAEALRNMAPAGTFPQEAGSAPMAPPAPPQQAPILDQGNPAIAQTSPVMPPPSVNEQPGNQALVNALRAAPEGGGSAGNAPRGNEAPELIKEQWRRALQILPVNPELAQAMMKNASELTNEQRNMAALGQDPRLMGALGIAESKKRAMLELQPGTTTRDMLTGQERFQPKVGEGIALNNGSASAIPGYAGANASIAGEAARATEAAKAGYDLGTVNLPTGPVMMTRAQQVNLAQGQPQPPQPAPNQPPGAFSSQVTPQLLDSLRMVESGRDKFAVNKDSKAMGPYQFMPDTVAALHRQGYEFNPFNEKQAREAAAMLLNQNLQKHDGDMNKALAAYGGFVKKDPTEYINKIKSGMSPAQAGIKLQSEEQKAFGSSIAKGAGDELLKGRDKAMGAMNSLYGIEQSQKAIQSGAFLGSGANQKTDLAKFMNSTFGTSIAADKVTNAEYLRSTLGTALLDQAKKLGANPTEADAKRAEQRGLSSPYDLSVQLPQAAQPSASAAPQKLTMPTVDEIQAELARRRGKK